MSDFDTTLLELRGNYDAISKFPLKEYQECNGVCQELNTGLIAVKKNGKWGYADEFNQLKVPIIYDNVEYVCYNGILILSKNGKQGGVFVHGSGGTAFEFKYDQLTRMFNQTYSFRNTDGTYSLIKPYDVVISSHRYAGFYHNDHKRYITFKRYNFLGRLIEGQLDLETGKEL